MNTLADQELARKAAVRRSLLEAVEATTAPGRSTRLRTGLIAAGSVAAAGLLAVGVLAIALPSVTAAPTVVAAPSFDLDALPAATGGGTSDFVVFTSPAELAAVSSLIVQGTVREVIEADIPAEITDPWGSASTIVLVLDVTSVLKGSLDLRSDGTFQLAIPGYYANANGTSLAEWNALFPAGTEVVAYPERAWAHSWGFGNVPPAEVDPTEEPMYLQWHPQGFAVHIPGSNEVAWPLLHDEKVGRFEDALPGGTLIGTVR
ncbi:hypothetical protein [Cryobacterium sp. SO1]|uniref:hypothetical protein n=1 Tax=Cryobacterium sp. SO1 TaxID=1897061 RepID=UPI001023C66E|nr:hypothetical protein [Cryobacterium sp. SO1]RZI35522.1 hypothetical protein BJQ95_02091 [Cryobacterium sp. SO1]